MQAAREFRPSVLLSFLACLVSFAPLLAQSDASLRVVATDNRGFPDPNAALTLVSEDRVRTAKVDKVGEFEFTNLPARNYELEVSSPSFKDVTIPNILIKSGDRRVLTLKQELYSPPFGNNEPACPSLEIDGLPGLNELVAYEERNGNVNFTGRIANIFTSKPIKDATITLFRSGATGKAVSESKSDENGTFEFSGVEPGNYTFSVSRGGYYDAPRGFRLWITRENVTRIGTILMFPDSTQDICGMGTIDTPERNPVASPTPELIHPDIRKKNR